MTTFGDGVFQYGGSPVGTSLLASKIFSTKTKGRAWFVDGTQGNNGGGRSPNRAFRTMAGAFAVAQSGDIIYLIGKVTEQLVTPNNVFDVTVIGCGNRPRHADATPATGNYAAAQWAPPTSGAVSGQATVRVIKQGWRFVNILFTMESATAAGVEIVRDAGAGDAEIDGSHCEILGCRFAGAGVGVRISAPSYTENPFNVRIEGNKFNGCTYGIRGVNAQPNMIDIIDNNFQSCTNAITAQLQFSLIKHNTIMGFTAASSSGGIDLNGGVAGNCVTLNYLGGTYSNAGGYRAAGAGDEWGANMNVISGGWTAADPA